MYTQALRAASNRADWSWSATLKNRSTGVVIDLTGATIELVIAEQQAGAEVLAATTGSDARITFGTPTLGVFTVFVPASVMAELEADQYDIGVRLTLASGLVYQLIRTTIAIVEGFAGR